MTVEAYFLIMAGACLVLEFVAILKDDAFYVPVFLVLAWMAGYGAVAFGL